MPPRNRSKARVSGTEKRRSVTGKLRLNAGIRSAISAPRPDDFPVAGLRFPPFRRVVRIHNGHSQLQLDRRAIATAIQRLDTHAAELLNLAAAPSALHPVPPGELSVAFLTDAALARLHATFLADPSPTDVLTFAGIPALGQAGEICVSADTARAFAAGHRHDLSEELTLYIVHGWLHLAGHDDRQPEQKKRMRAAEARALTLLRASRAIPQFVFAPAGSGGVAAPGQSR